MLTATSTNATACMVQDYDLEGAIASLRSGDLILYPTDTIWSIGCDATNTRAIERIIKLKRAASASLHFEILVDSLQMLKHYVNHLHPRLETLLVYHVRPLTVVLDQARNLPANLITNDGSIAIRVVQDQYCRELIKAFGHPIVATFANVIDDPIPAHFGAISSEILQGVDYVSKFRQHEKNHGQPSVMVRLSDQDELLFLRD